MGKNPRRAATARVLRSIQQAALRCVEDVECSSAHALTETLEKRQMLSASPIAVRKSLSKLDSNLQSAFQQYQVYSTTETAAQKAAKKSGVPVSIAPFAATDSILQTVGSDVFIQAYANAGYSKALTLALTRLKGQDVANNGEEIDALFPISELGKLARLGGLRFAEPTAYEVNSGSALSQGDAEILGPEARSLYNVSGAGVTVGILSDSFNTDTAISDHYANDVASGDLPANVEILSDATPGTGTDEGRAMAQVIYDTAPSASFAFATGGASYATANKSVQALVTAGAKVIVDDLTYENEPFFQDGVLAQTVANVVANDGVDYVSAAGNFGEDSYANTWTSGTTYAAGAIMNVSGAPYFYGGTSFSFTGVTGGNDQNSFSLSSGSNIKISFQWDQPYYSVSGGSGARNQVDAYVLNSSGQIVGGSANLTIGADPIQLFQFTNTTGSTGNYSLMLVSEAGTALPGQIKYIDFSGQASNWAYSTNSSTIFGHANAAGVESVGAANDNSGTPILESYSSEGGTTASGGTPILFNTSGGRLAAPVYRQSPSLVAPDDVYTTFYVSPGTAASNPPIFSGTSASAAAVAGVITLIVQKNPALTPAAIDSILATTTLPVQGQTLNGQAQPIANGLDGAGFVQAIPALTDTVGNITGVVYSDNNADGVEESGETGVNGILVYLDSNNNGALDPGEPYATTATVNGVAGTYEIYNQSSGTAVIRVMAPAGYVAVTTGRSVAIAGANTSSGVNFGIFPDAYSTSANGSNYTLQVDPTTPANFDVLVNNVLTYTAPLTLVPALSFRFTGNNSSLTVNFANGDPIPGGGITEAAPLNYQGYSNNDVLIVNGTSAADTANVRTTLTTFDGSAIAINNITAETINGNGGNDAFTVTTAPPPLYQASSGALVYGTLTFNGGIGDDSLTVNDILPNGGIGTTFNAGTNAIDQNTLTVNAGQFYFAGNPAAQSANLTVNLGNAQVTDPGTGNVSTSYASVFFAPPTLNGGIAQRNLAALNIGPQSEAIVAAPVDHNDRAVLITGSLNISAGGIDSAGNIASGGIVDLNANDMIITNGSLAAIQPLLSSGYNSGNWNGSGIQSSAAASDTTRLTALGSLQNNGQFSSFDGATNIASAVLIKYTYYGDADLNGKVDGSDYSRIDNGILTNATGWANGDFNYDGTIDGSDYTLLDNAYNTQGPSIG